MMSPKQRAGLERKRYRRLRRFIRQRLGQETHDRWLRSVRGYTPQEAERLFTHWLYMYLHHTTVSSTAARGWYTSASGQR